MPRTTFGINSLNAAAPGMSRLAASLVGGDQAYQQGFDQAATGQSKIALALAQIRNQNSEAGAHDATAAETRAKTGILATRPDLFNEQVANNAGTDVPTVSAYRTQLRTGAPATVPMGPPTEQGTMGATPLPGDIRTKIGAALQQFLPLLSNTGDLKPDDMAKAAQMFRDSGLSDAIINGTVDRNRVAGAQAAVAAKPLYNQNQDGAVLDQYGGGLDTANPMARASIGLRGAQAGEANARAGLARTQADEAKAGGKGQFDASLGMVIDTRNGTARPVMGPDGKPIGPKAGSGSLNQEQANALTFATRMQAADAILTGLAKDGVSQPGAIKRTAEALPGFIGGGEGGNLGSMANWTQSGSQQQVEQAQRDFVNAVLRRESGAAISSGEFANAKQQYFPQQGDKDPVLRQKAAARARVIQGMLAAVPPNQRTLPELPGTPAKPIVVDY